MALLRGESILGVPRYWKAGGPGVHVHDRVSEIARAKAELT